MMNTLVIIPARGGSKGIPRKNIRPLCGKPLIYYQINNALNSSHSPDVYVSSDDDEILSIASKFGANTHKREKRLAQTETTLDPVVYDALNTIANQTGKDYHIVIVLQPTAPLLQTATLDKSIQKMKDDPALETIISATDDTHLSWHKVNGRYMPAYEKRVNRQFLPKVFRENGAFTISRREVVRENSRFGENVDLCLLDGGEAIDIDTFEDWNLCEYYLKRKTILFVVTGYAEIGLGHVYNSLLLANDILDHRIVFLVDAKSQLAYQKINENNYEVHIQTADNILEDILAFSPDVIINDILDTSRQYIEALKQNNRIVINFEDIGNGSQHADLVFNAMYPEKRRFDKHYYGPQYVLLRDEFYFSDYNPVNERVKTVLITFGGVDPNNYTHKVIEAIYAFCKERKITIKVVAGLGYSNYDSLIRFPELCIFRNSNHISDFMLDADIAFTSAGRTTYELAAIGTPTIVMAQNQREQTHFFATHAFGFENLGLGYRLENQMILEVFREITGDHQKRRSMSELMRSVDVRKGRNRVVEMIKGLIREVE